jgi:hypothetical protein
MKFTLRHPYAIEPEAFWREVFFDPEYNSKLYLEGLRFEGFTTLEETNPPDGKRTRKVKAKPRLDAPGPIKAMIGDSVSYVEEGRLEPGGPNGPKWVSRVIPSAMTEKTTVNVTMWLERTGPGQSDRVAEFDVTVKGFGGGLVEKFMEKSMRDNYQKAADWTNQYLRARKPAS